MPNRRDRNSSPHLSDLFEELGLHSHRRKNREEDRDSLDISGSDRDSDGTDYGNGYKKKNKKESNRRNDSNSDYDASRDNSGTDSDGHDPSGSDEDSGHDSSDRDDFDLCIMLGLQDGDGSDDSDKDDDDDEEEEEEEEEDQDDEDDDGENDDSNDSNDEDDEDEEGEDSDEDVSGRRGHLTSTSSSVAYMAMDVPKGTKKGGRGYMWPIGETLKVRFLDGPRKYHKDVMTHAKTWEKYANIQFKTVTSGRADIRITFEKMGWYSYVGTRAKDVPQAKHTMNLQVRQDTDPDDLKAHVLHEFGHVLGCIHEHSSPGRSIPWNKKRVYQTYTGPPNNWTRDMVKENVLERKESSMYSKFDRKSIMLYPIDPNLTTNGMGTQKNMTLSKTDKEFIGKMYPFKKNKNARRK